MRRSHKAGHRGKAGACDCAAPQTCGAGVARPAKAHCAFAGFRLWPPAAATLRAGFSQASTSRGVCAKRKRRGPANNHGRTASDNAAAWRLYTPAQAIEAEFASEAKQIVAESAVFAGGGRASRGLFDSRGLRNAQAAEQRPPHRRLAARRPHDRRKRIALSLASGGGRPRRPRFARSYRQPRPAQRAGRGTTAATPQTCGAAAYNLRNRTRFRKLAGRGRPQRQRRLAGGLYCGAFASGKNAPKTL
ncbi:MAG: hypothetical protein Pg6A_08300 [Termitinemataceae bacterium]|nr:MAG: hypothetical protein Pg6A_08300 [Termitinemataceae bacterium]